MGGMQSLQWAVTHPTIMDRVVAITQSARMALMLDPAYDGGAYTAQPETGWRMHAAFFDALIVRTPLGMNQEFPNATDMLAFQRKQEDNRIAIKVDANDWIWQSIAYDGHNVGGGSNVYSWCRARYDSLAARALRRRLV